MAYSRNSNFHPIAKNRIAYRYRQAMVLIATIIFGMIISAAVNAIPSSKKTTVATKAPQESHISDANKTN
jgi:hypothetical protein